VGGFLVISIGRGGRSTILNKENGVATSVSYDGMFPFTVYAPGGKAGVVFTASNFSPDGNGMYGGGGADGLPPLPPGDGFQDGFPAIPGVKGGNGGGIYSASGGPSSAINLIFGGGGGGGSPGSINDSGGDAGGVNTLNGSPGIKGGGGGGGGIRIISSAGVNEIEIGRGGNGGDGYVSIYFFP
jgi:hypothetical protein